MVGLGAAGLTIVLLRTAVLSGPWGVSSVATWGQLATLVLTAAAVIAAWVLPAARVGWRRHVPIAVGLLLCLSAAVAAAWPGGPTLLRIAAVMVVPLLGPVLLATAEWIARGRATVSLVAGSVVLVTSAALGLVRPPFEDPGCWATCSLRYDPWFPHDAAGTLLDRALTVEAFVVVLVACVLAGLLLLRTLQRPRVDSLLDLTVASVAMAGTATHLASLRAGAGTVGPVRWTVVVLVVLAGVLCVAPLLAIARRHRLLRLAESWAELPEVGELEGTLAGVLGDRHLRVAYWLPESCRFVDASGAPVEASEGPVRLVRSGSLLAAVRLSAAHRDAGEQVALLGSAARLAVDNERLQAELRAQLTDLRTSRLRIVDEADRTRRAVERDLHDVVQAELLGILFELGRMSAATGRAGDLEARADIESLRDELREVTDQLRSQAHSLHPAALDSLGLGAALERVAQDAAVIVDIQVPSDHRPAQEVETAIYLLVRDAILRATEPVSVAVGQVDGATVVSIAGYRGPVPESLQDRIGAIDGVVEWSDDTLQAVLP